VRIGSLLIGGLIERSAAAELFDAGRFADVEDGELPRMHPDTLADRYWALAQDDAPVEQQAP
jgi:hypothetical protein